MSYVWRYTINVARVWHAKHLTFEEKRDGIVRKLRNSQWLKDDPYRLNDVTRCVDNLADTNNPSEFDIVWNHLYGLADRDRAWIATV